MTVENVHEAISVIWRRSRCGLTSIVTSPPSPTKHMVPQTFVLRMALSRASRIARRIERQVGVLARPSAP